MRRTKPVIFLDPGHGMSNRTPNVFDPGCVMGKLQEADIVLRWSASLARALKKLGAEVVQSRTNNSESCPLESRAKWARINQAKYFISLHVNDADSATASGTETLIYSDISKPLAARVHRAVIAQLGLRDRGIKLRDGDGTVTGNRKAIGLGGSQR
ncbi:MAG: N-acetylmuramoyl-L-alanine amidase, partial [Rhodobacteraceae bacterium]|nr:N-acetylmuramoyl-L-alanine amidase [Paracoccaceae bacterium]